MANASAMSPATWPVRPDWPSPRAEESETGSAFRLAGCGWIPGEESGVADGLIAGNRPDALPAPMSELDTPLRFGIGPSGRGATAETAAEEAPADDLADDLAGDADAAAVTATVSAADGGVHFAEVTMLAVAVSFTEVTEVAPDATGIWAWRLAGCLSATEVTVQPAVPSPLAQPLVNDGFWLDGWATRATDTFAADPLFSVETCTVKAAFCPRLTLDCERWTVTHSSGWADVLVELALVLVLVLVLALGLELVANWASSEAGLAV